jgi:methyl-accepting chemotaxis protein
MHLKLNISQKILLGYFLIILFVIVATALTLLSIQKNRQINNRIANVCVPSVSYLNNLQNLVVNSKMLIKNWVFISSKANTPEKLHLARIQQTDVEQVDSRLEMLLSNWPQEDRSAYAEIITTIRDTLFLQQKYVMSLLSDFESYNKPAVMFEATSMVEEENDEIMLVTNRVLNKLEGLISSQEKSVLQAKQEMKNAINKFTITVIILGLFIILSALLAAYLTLRSVVHPLLMLKSAIREINEEGNTDVQVLIKSDDEIQDLADGINQMAVTIKGNYHRVHS